MEVFTPLNEAKTERLRFNIEDVELIEGDLHVRGYGQKAIVKIGGKTYKVIGLACSLPSCACDAYIKEIA